MAKSKHAGKSGHHYMWLNINRTDAGFCKYFSDFAGKVWSVYARRARRKRHSPRTFQTIHVAPTTAMTPSAVLTGVSNVR